MDLPPMQQWARTFMNSPSAMMFFSVCPASSRVGLITRAWILHGPRHSRLRPRGSPASVSTSTGTPARHRHLSARSLHARCLRKLFRDVVAFG